MTTSKENVDAFAYDDAFRTMEGECDDILIPFVRLNTEHEMGFLSALSYGVIMNMTERVMNKLANKHASVIKKVGDSMGGKVLDLPEIRAYHEGKAEGVAIGKAEGKAEGEAKRQELLKENERLLAILKSHGIDA